MKYRLRNNYSTNPDKALKEILTDRGVTDIENFIIPSKECELNPHNLENIDAAAEKLLYHLVLMQKTMRRLFPQISNHIV